MLSPDVVSCSDVEVTFSCQVPQQSGVLVWRITLLSNGIELVGQLQDRTYITDDQPGSSTVMSGGFSFHFTLVETSPALQSTMRTSLPLSLNTTLVECLPNTAITGLTSDTSLFLFIGMLDL